VIEFHGPEGCGKTEMLLHLIANCILPPKWKDIQIGGHGISIVYVNTDFHFQVLRLVTILECRIENAAKHSNRTSTEKVQVDNNESIQVCDSQDIEKFIKSCLSRLYVLHCNSSLELLASLISLEQMLIAKPEVCVIMIDSLSSFYWIDRSTGGDSPNDQEENLRKVVTIINKYSKEFLMVVVVTTHAIFSTKPSEHYFCRTWSSVVKYRYLFRLQDGCHSNSLNPKSLFIAQRTLPRSNHFKRFYITEKGVEFRS